MIETKESEELKSTLNNNANKCIWKHDEAWRYKTSCGNYFQFANGGVSNNDFKFCPYCGLKIEVKD